MCAVVIVIFGNCGSVGLLCLVVVAIRKWSTDLVSIPKPRRETLKHVTIFKTPLHVGNIERNISDSLVRNLQIDLQQKTF
jgi:hypothetical protein